MAESQYYEVLKQDEKSSEQQYFSNVEDQTVQYVITPNKTQTQFPTQQIVVARGDQLMLLNGQPQQIVIDQSVIPYPTNEIQLQPRQQIKQVMRLTNPIQQLPTNQIQLRATVPQAIPSQPPMRSPNPNQIPRPPAAAQQLLLRQHLPASRAATSGGPRTVGVTSAAQQIASGGPRSVGVASAAQQMRQLNAGVVRQPAAGQQIRLTTLSGQLRQQAPRGQPRFPGMQQLQKAKSQGDMDDMETKSAVEQETVSLPDGSIVTVGTYKKMLAEQKARNNIAQRMNPPHPPSSSPAPLTMAPPTPTPKRRAPANRNPRQAPRGGMTRGQPRPPASQAGSFQTPPPGVNKDPSQFAMMNQHQGMGKPAGVYPQQQQQMQQQGQMLQQQQFQQQQQIQQQHQIQQQLQQQMAQEQQLRQSQANYVIQPPRANQKPQQQRPLPAYIPSSQIQKIIESTPISEEFSDSIRMLVLLENGEQRLITFTLPKEACTIQEILEQVNVPFQSHTNIQVTEANSNGINYIVTVGNVPPLGYEEDDPHQPPHHPDASPPPTPPAPPMPALPSSEPPPLVMQPPPLSAHLSGSGPPALLDSTTAAPSSPEPPKEAPRLVAGMLALCGACGYLSEDFNKCIRCNRKLPDNVKSISATIKANNGQTKEIMARQQVLQQKPQLPIKSSLVPKPPSPVKKKPTKKQSEQDSVHVISSDEEEEEDSSKLTENILQKLGASVTISPVTKEPSMNDLQRHSSQNSTASISDQPNDSIRMKLKCRTVRIGSYRCIPIEEIQIDSAYTVIQVPHPTKDKDIRTIRLEKAGVVKVLASFNSSLPVVFFYLSPGVAERIRVDLDMTAGGPYYLDPLALDEESQRRITLLPDDIDDADKNLMQLIFGGGLEELNVKEANDILIKTCPKDLAKAALGFGTFTEIKQLLTYPPEGKGRIAINTEDYICLGQDQFLNDVIIDFYLKYLVANLPDEQKPKVHVFSTFFYKRLTTKPTKASRKSQPAELDPTLSGPEKRHARVKNWTKNVNLFEKDFVVVPINENAHWFLAIICFPGMDGCQTWDGQPYKLEPARSRVKKKLPIATIGAVSVTAVKQEKAKPILCDDPETSDKDEAEGDDSELESDDSEEAPAAVQPANPAVLALVPQAAKGHKEVRPAIKQPCILIFDSLAGANRSRVVATLRDYLTCEYKLKMGKERVYSKDVIKGANPKVPQQNNFTDCGLYVLQYVEQFFKDPIKDYNIPIKEIQNWFEEVVVTRKREEIADLLRNLMREYGKDTRLLPDINFPTVNGKVVEHDAAEEEEEEHEAMEEEEGPSTAEEDADMKEGSLLSNSGSKSDMFSEGGSSADETRTDGSLSPLKPSNDGVSGDFLSQTVVNPKPDLSEFPRHTSKDTLSILKAKRIIRHKTLEGPQLKRSRSEQN
ncbi:unnamed protein product [Phaedon cochleariae]|uniref:Ubiquitin-like protease family profile domain-containing protein n=1 Tax=Phaedon cochleariae TaxID=80249 RepID=A0A9N9X5L6_PHACE|nr:unnamed protein product [Phaedon cochleariae]